jgi:hypothetical protein
MWMRPAAIIGSVVDKQALNDARYWGILLRYG